MSQPKYNVLAVGNAILDVLSEASEDFVEQQAAHGVVKGTMNLIDEDRARQLYDAMGPTIETSGGSAANTMAAFAAMGGTGAFIGKVAEDQLGQMFRHDMRAAGVDFETTPLVAGAPTARCLILVTPDAQRTMNTYLGATVELGPDDIDQDKVASAEITYLEGYLFDKDSAKRAFITAANAARDAGHKVALSLSDTFCVERHFEDFHKLVDNHIDILFGNEAELLRLYETPDVEEAVEAARRRCEIVIATRSEKGAILTRGADERHDIDAVPPAELVDSTGAGDVFAAGVLYGLTHDLDLRASGRLGALAASQVLAHMGPRTHNDLSDLVRQVRDKAV